jgi:hypothetical protein
LESYLVRADQGLSNYRQVFILTFEDGTDIVARLNGSSTRQDEDIADDLLAHRTASEVRTRIYVSLVWVVSYVSELGCYSALRAAQNVNPSPSGVSRCHGS